MRTPAELELVKQFIFDSTRPLHSWINMPADERLVSEIACEIRQFFLRREQRCLRPFGGLPPLVIGFHPRFPFVRSLLVLWKTEYGADQLKDSRELVLER